MVMVREVILSVHWAEVRCGGCRRLLLKWAPSGVAEVNVKCPRCGRIDSLRLSTA